MKTKICGNCETEKELKSFDPQERKDGTFRYQKNCNTCRCILTRIRKHGVETLQKPSPYLFCEETMRQLKICSCCKKVLIFDKFANLYSGITSECSACRKENRKGKDYSLTQKRLIERKRACPETLEKMRQQWRKYDANKTFEQKERKKKQNREFLKNNPDKREKYKRNNKLSRLNRLAQMSEPERELFLEKERKGRRMRRLIRQARERNGEIIAAFTKEDIINRDGLNCYICDKLLKISEVTIDHVLPLARGGHHKPENAKIACRFCNLSKGAKTLTEYKKYRGDYARFKRGSNQPLLFSRLSP